LQPQSTEKPVQIPIHTFSHLAILGIVNKPERLSRLRGILSQSNWKLSFAENAEEARRLLASRPMAIVLIDRFVPEQTWREVLAWVRAAPHPPSVVMVCGQDDESRSRALVNQGIYAVFGADLDAVEIRSMVSHAGRLWYEGLQRDANGACPAGRPLFDMPALERKAQ
jgi:response regulator RpfG family c-di-GMP phosphodiesterase